ncbi:YafY family transcriptional regulator [Paenibacillus sp. P25]|nr:YafY family transcriptional regulator [Paenibacillus sp. P25]
MSKSKRLVSLMIAVNKKRKFTVRELAEEFQVSPRTIMRDLQSLEELGLPLYAEYGPYGGYRVLNERMLPPIMFSEEEATAMFFAYQSLQHYGALPWNEESVTALNKFYYYLPDDTKRKIDQMKERVVFWSPKRAAVPHLRLLLDAALQRRPSLIVYHSRDGAKERTVQPVGVYSHNGYWYSPSYDFAKERFLLFRADRVLQADWADDEHRAMDLGGFPISDWFKPPEEQGSRLSDGSGRLELTARLTAAGVRRRQWENRFEDSLEVHPDGTGAIKLRFGEEELDHFASYFISLGADVIVEKPDIMVERIREEVARLHAAYNDGEPGLNKPVTDKKA